MQEMRLNFWNVWNYVVLPSIAAHCSWRRDALQLQADAQAHVVSHAAATTVPGLPTYVLAQDFRGHNRDVPEVIARRHAEHALLRVTL